MLMAQKFDDEFEIPAMPVINETDDDWQNPDPLSAARGMFHGFLMSAGLLAVVVVGFVLLFKL